jgi:hypothetical protein
VDVGGLVVAVRVEIPEQPLVVAAVGLDVALDGPH